MTKIELELEQPKVPNFIRIKGFDQQTISVGDLSDDQLREIGNVWTENLIDRADEIRKTRIPR